MPNEVGRSRAEPGEPKAPYALDLRHALPLSHGFLAIDYDWVRIVNNAVSDGIRQNGITDLILPSRNIELGAEDGGSLLVSCLGNFKQISCFCFLQRVECKKYNANNPISVKLVRELYGTVEADKATAGMLITTSYFTKDAKEFTEKTKHRMALRDYNDLVQELNVIKY